MFSVIKLFKFFSRSCRGIADKEPFWSKRARDNKSFAGSIFWPGPDFSKALPFNEENCPSISGEFPINPSIKFVWTATLEIKELGSSPPLKVNPASVKSFLTFLVVSSVFPPITELLSLYAWVSVLAS